LLLRRLYRKFVLISNIFVVLIGNLLFLILCIKNSFLCLRRSVKGLSISSEFFHSLGFKPHTVLKLSRIKWLGDMRTFARTKVDENICILQQFKINRLYLVRKLNLKFMWIFRHELLMSFTMLYSTIYNLLVYFVLRSKRV
jgi:hypothetical protein